MNARSLKSVTTEHNKLVEIKNLLCCYSPILLAVTETWLTDDILDAEILPPSYAIHRKDRSETDHTSRRGGGLLLAFRNDVPSKRRSDLEPPCEILVSIMMPSGSSKIAIILCYRPPAADRVFFNECLELTLTRVAAEFKNIVMLGDFNLPDIKWQSTDCVSRGTDSAFVRITQSFSLEQLNTVPSNAHNNLLDLIFVSNLNIIRNIMHIECDFPSDHNVLHFDINVDHSKNVKNDKRTFYNYRRANVPALNTCIDDKGLLPLISAHSDVDSMWNSWYDGLLSVIESNVPKVKRRSNNEPPWFDSETKHLVNKKRTMWRKARKSNSAHHWTQFKLLRIQVKRLLRTKHQSYLTSLGDICTQNPKRFWSFFHSITKSRSLPSLLYDNARSTSSEDAQVKSNMFNDFFCSVFTLTVNPCPTVTGPVLSDPVPCPDFAVNDIESVLKEIDVSKACAPNDISPFILKNCRSVLSSSLTWIFNTSVRKAKVPSAWKRSHVIPIFKKGDKSHVSNYRPISLLVSASKILERCMFNHLYPHVSPLLHHLQHGFMKKRSCTTQLLKVYHDIGKILDQGGQIDVVYLDYSKAFDCVSHKYLLFKLKHFFNFSDGLISWISDYLSGRSQTVLVDGFNSDWKPVTSGVPQGSILGPFLFLLFINDMPNCINSSTTALFADDCKVFKSIKSLHDCTAVQNDLSAMHEWSNNWQMSFNAAKCKILTITRSRSPILYNYHLDGTMLERVGEFKDLGITFDNNLKFTTHVNSIISKANKLCGVIKRAVGYRAPQNVKVQLYKSLVRPNLEYSTQVWSPYFKNEILSIESVQRSMTRYILNNYDSSYVERCTILEFLPLSYRREFLDLVFIFKCIHDLFDVDFSPEFSFLSADTNRRSAQNGILLMNSFTRTEHFKSSYFNRIPHLWNILPYKIRMSSTLCDFKMKLTSFYRTKFLSTFNIDIPCTFTSTCRCNGFYH